MPADMPDCTHGSRTTLAHPCLLQPRSRTTTRHRRSPANEHGTSTSRLCAKANNDAPSTVVRGDHRCHIDGGDPGRPRTPVSHRWVESTEHGWPSWPRAAVARLAAADGG